MAARERVDDGVRVPDCVWLSVPVVEAETLAVLVSVDVALVLGEWLGVAVRDTDEVCVPVRVREELRVAVRVRLGEKVCEGVCEILLVAVRERVNVADCVRDTVGVRVPVAVTGLVG